MPDPEIEVLQAQLAAAAMALQKPVVAPPPAVSHPVFVEAPCFVCQAPTVSPKHNGRCRPCWEFFRTTGTDRTPDEVASTGTTPVQEIISKGVLTVVSTLKKAGKAKGTPTKTTTPAAPVAGPLGVGTGRYAGKPAKPCADCGTTIYGATVTICVPCLKQRKARKAQAEVVA